jgi:poly(3-hydroxybutyrate) depolymerase
MTSDERAELVRLRRELRVAKMEAEARGSGEAGILAGITQQVLTSDTRWNIDPGRVYVCGISAGAAMAVILGATHPDLYAAVGIHAGLEYRAATDPSTARSAMANGGPDPIQQGTAAFTAMDGRAWPVPTIVFHGTADGVVKPVNSDQVVQQWMETNRLATENAYRPDFARTPTRSAAGNTAARPGSHRLRDRVRAARRR